jgi:fatty-acyl-CoA synthase
LGGSGKGTRSGSGEALELIERERCSIYYGMPNMARALLEHPDHPKRRLGAMRTGLTIGPPEDIAMTIKALGAEELCNVYGLTETPIASYEGKS